MLLQSFGHHQKNMNSKTKEVMEETRHYGICHGIIGGQMDRGQN